jgi:hypothetical protein
MSLGIGFDGQIDRRHHPTINLKGPCNSYLRGPFAYSRVFSRPGSGLRPDTPRRPRAVGGR